MSQTSPSSQPLAPLSSRPLMRHTRCSRWGRALLLWEREHKRGYQFEDGEVRVFAEDYYDLMQPAARPDPVARQQLREHAIANGEIGASEVKAGKKSAGAVPLPTLEDQVAVFDQVYSGGFFGADWTHEKRARPSGRALKRHRDAAIEYAKTQLDEAALRELVDQGRPHEVMQRIVDVSSRTDLVTAKQISIFEGVGLADVELANAWIAFLHDRREGELATMARLRRALARHDVRKITWPALTAARALLHPSDHAWVHPTSLRKQAKHVMPTVKIPSVPSASEYGRILELTMFVRQHLTEVGFAPRDLFDVTDFIRATLAAKQKDLLREAMVGRRTKAAADATTEPVAEA